MKRPTRAIDGQHQQRPNDNTTGSFTRRLKRGAVRPKRNYWDGFTTALFGQRKNVFFRRRKRAGVALQNSPSLLRPFNKRSSGYARRLGSAGVLCVLVLGLLRVIDPTLGRAAFLFFLGSNVLDTNVSRIAFPNNGFAVIFRPPPSRMTWNSPPTARVFVSPPLHSLPQDSEAVEPDYAELYFDTLYPDDFERYIWDEEYVDYERQRYQLIADMDTSAPRFMPPRFDPDDELLQPQSCQRPLWQSAIYPTCNPVHEIVLNMNTDKYLGSGAYRQTWKIADNGQSSTFVLKQSIMPEDDDDINHLPSFVSFYKTQRDAIVMERLTASPRIVNMYAHCGLTIASETMEAEIVPVIVPGTGRATAQEIKNAPFGPRNNLTLVEKVDMALSMASALADLHGHAGLIVHGDVHPVQWLRAKDGTLRLNDFNNAELLDFNPAYGVYCKSNRGKWGGMYRSPEEFLGLSIDEKSDVFSMGNNIYTLLTGLWPFYEHDDYDEIQYKILVDREQPYVDERYRKNSFVEQKLIELMLSTWEFQPEDRPTIFEMITILRDIKNNPHGQRARRGRT